MNSRGVGQVGARQGAGTNRKATQGYAGDVWMLSADLDGMGVEGNHPNTQKRRLRFRKAAFSYSNIDRGDFLVLGRPGSDLLSQGLSHSTIGAEEFNGRVRDGIGLRLFAKTTRPAKDKEYEASDLCWRHPV
jgi:hypothetical protein